MDMRLSIDGLSLADVIIIVLHLKLDKITFNKNMSIT